MNTNDFPEKAIRGLDGKVMTVDLETVGTSFVCELVREYLGYEITSEYTDKNQPTNDGCFIPVGDKHQRKLTVAEVAAIEAFVWLSKNYLNAVKRNAPVSFPKVIHNIADEYADDAEWLTFNSEARAVMFAGVLENTFCFDAEVIEGPHGWIVAAKDRGSQMWMVELYQMQGACQVLCNYTVTPASNACAGDSDRSVKYPDPESRTAWQDRHNAPLTRIEDGINAILAHLGHPEAAKADAPAGDSHTRPTKKTAKPSAKSITSKRSA